MIRAPSNVPRLLLLAAVAAATALGSDPAAAPAPWRTEDVFVESGADGVRLAGTLTLPEGGPPRAAVLFLTGMGPQDRDETLGPHRPFAVLAEGLARRGVASLRLDDRGVGGSGGDWLAADYAGLARDHAAAVALLRGQPGIDPRRLGLLGHSEGGRLAVRAAAAREGIAFVVLLAAPCVPGEAFILRHNGDMLRRAGAPDEVVARELEGLREVLAVLRAEPEPARRQERIHELVLRKGQPPAAAEAETALLASPWARDYMTCDITPDLRSLRCPVLALWGDRDVLVAPGPNAEALRAALPPDAAGPREIAVLPGLNHLLQRCETGEPDEFFRLPEAIDPAVVARVAGWVADLPAVR